MASVMVSECGGCGSSALELVLDLGSSAPSCSMRRYSGEEPIYPLQLIRCVVCSLVQLSCIVDPAEIFHPDYPYSSGNTKALHENFADLAGSVSVCPGDVVVDIGANDGTLLSKFPDYVKKVAVEPTNQIDKCGPSIERYETFFGVEVAKHIVKRHGPARIVTACNVLAHTADLEDTMLGLAILLAPDGILVAENHNLSSIVDGNQWDTIYHEHLRYYSPESFATTIAHYGIHAHRVQPIKTHGGSFRTYGTTTPAEIEIEKQESDWPHLREQAIRARRELRAALAVLTGEGKSIWGVGSAARATTVMGYCGLGAADLECVCEVSTSDKLGRLMPGTSIPVVDEEALFGEEPPDYALLFSWHLADRIMLSLRTKGYEGKFIIPLPELSIV